MEKIIFLTIWSFLFGLTVYGLHKEQSMYSKQGQPIADLIEKTGSVQFRTEESILWDDVDDKQSFFKGDNVSTGPNGIAKIKFKDSAKILELGGNSQVSLELNQRDDQLDYLVTLLRGSVAAKIASIAQLKKSQIEINSQAPSLAIATKTSKFDLSNPFAGILLSKKRGEASVQIENASGKIMVQNSKGTTTPLKENLQTIQNLMPDVKVNPERIQEISLNYKREGLFEQRIQTLLDKAQVETSPEAQETILNNVEKLKEELTEFKSEIATNSLEVKVDQFLPDKKYLPQIILPDNNSHYWLLASLDQRKINLPITVHHQHSKIAGSSSLWVPIVKIADHENSSETRKSGVTNQTKQSLSLPLETFKGSAKFRSDEPTKSIELRLSAGLAPLVESEKEGASFSKQSQIVHLSSLTDTTEDSVVILLNQLKVRSLDDHLLIEQTSEISSSKAKFKLFLDSAKRISKVSPLLASNKGFAIKKAPLKVDTQGIYFVKGETIIAKLESKSSLPIEQIRMTRKLLQARLVFKGHPTAFYREDRLGNIKPDQNKAGADTVYMVSGDNVVEVSADFLKANKEVAEFVKQNASTTFSGELVIIDHE